MNALFPGRKNPCESCREICVPCMILSQETGAYVSTIKKLALEPGFLTCATLANRIAQKTGATAAQRDMLVNPIHHGKWKSDKRFKALKFEKAIPQTPAAEPEPQTPARAVVMIDRRGTELMRFPNVAEALACIGDPAQAHPHRMEL